MKQRRTLKLWGEEMPGLSILEVVEVEPPDLLERTLRQGGCDTCQHCFLLRQQHPQKPSFGDQYHIEVQEAHGEKYQLESNQE